MRQARSNQIMSAVILPFKRGRMPAVHTRRTMRLALAMHAAFTSLGTPPAVSDDYVSAVMKASPGGWGMALNNQLGDCVCADSAHQVMLHTANAGTIIIPTDQDVLALYEAVGGYKPGDASTDTGCDETSMEQYMMSTGLCGQKSAASGPVDPINVNHIRWAVQIFGACRLGITVDQRMESEFASRQPWETPADPNDPNAGGHDVPIVRYDAQYAYVVTWGGLQPVAWALVPQPAFLEEAHLAAYPDFVRAGGTAPNGFNLNAMLSAAQQVEMQEAA